MLFFVAFFIVFLIVFVFFLSHTHSKNQIFVDIIETLNVTQHLLPTQLNSNLIRAVISKDDNNNDSSSVSENEEEEKKQANNTSFNFQQM